MPLTCQFNIKKKFSEIIPYQVNMTSNVLNQIGNITDNFNKYIHVATSITTHITFYYDHAHGNC